MGVYLQLAELVIQNAAYLSCLAWLAWRAERSSGKDAFHLVVAYAAGAWLLSFLANGGVSRHMLAITAACVVSYIIDERMITRSGVAGGKGSLVEMIVVASLALITFDWVTSHTPISLLTGTIDAWKISWFCAAGAWLLIGLRGRSPVGLMGRLGVRNCWAMEYWSRPLPRQSSVAKGISLLCWVPVILVPMSTTGLLSSTIMKDVAITIMIAKVASTRGARVVLLACVTLALFRTAAGFVFLSNIGPPAVEAMVFLCLLLWLRYRGSRTAWGESLAR